MEFWVPINQSFTAVYYFIFNPGISHIPKTFIPTSYYAGDTLFFAHLSKTKNKTWGDWFDRIVVQKVVDPINWVEKSYSVGYNNGKMQDKPWISSDAQGNVYVTWTEFDTYGSKDPKDRSRIRFSKYTPEIDSFSSPVTISDLTGNCLDSDSTLEGATLCIGKQGKLYAIWAGFHKIWMDVSTDGGKTWGKDIVVANQGEGWDLDKPNISRSNGMPFSIYNSTKDKVQICYTDNSKVKLINIGPEKKSNATEIPQFVSKNTFGHQYFPNMVYDSASGKSYIVYFDTRNSKNNAFYDIYLTEVGQNNISTDIRITPNSIPLPGDKFFFGDYIDLDIQDSKLAIIYPVYDLNLKSSIELYLLENVNAIDQLTKTSKHFVPKTQVNAIQKNDSIYIYANAYINCNVKCKVARKRGLFTRTYRYKGSISTQGKADETLLGIAPISEYKYFKYKVKNLNTKEVSSRSIFIQ